MSDSQPQNRNKPLKGNPQMRMLTIWLVVFFAIFAVLFLTNNNSQQTTELTINEVVEYARHGKDSVIVPGAVLKSVPQGGPNWHEIRGQLRGSSGDNKQFLAKGR